MLPCEKIMRNCAWDMLPRCSRCSTTPCWDCSLGKEQAMSLMLDANSLIILIKPLPTWWLKGGQRLCNSPALPSHGACIPRSGGEMHLLLFLSNWEQSPPFIISNTPWTSRPENACQLSFERIPTHDQDF